MFARMRLSTRLNLIIIGINVVILVLVAVIAYFSSSLILRTEAIDRFTEKNADVTEELDTIFADVEAQADGLASALNAIDVQNSTALRNQILEYLEDSNAPRLITRISVTRSDQSVGVLSFSDANNLDDYQWRIYRLTRDLPTNTFIRQSFESGEPIWFRQVEPYFETMPRPVVSLAQPFTHADGDSMLWIDIPLTVVSDLVTDTLNDKGLIADTQAGYAMLVDQNDIPLTTHNVPDVDNMGRIVRSIFNEIEPIYAADDALLEHKDPFNNNQLGYFSITQLAHNNWHLMSVLPANEVPTLPSDVLAPILIVSIVGLIFLIYSVNNFITESIVQPLIHIGQSAAEIGDGNLRFTVSHQRRQDEVGTLAKALDNMRGRLRDSYSELETWSRRLEERVVERTQQLAMAQKQAEENAIQLRAVYDESRSVVNETQLRPVLDALIERLVMLFDATYCAVWLLTPDKTHIQLVATNDESRMSEGIGLIHANMDEGIVGQAITQRNPIVVDDYANYEHRMILTQDGTLPFHRGLCAPLMFVGQPVGAVVVGRPESGKTFVVSDERFLTLFANLVSPSVRNAQLFVQRQAAYEEANRANEVKTRFLASVTHELRTPLNLIINNMDFMRVGAFGEVSDEQVNRLNQTVRSAEHLLYLINDLLDVSKIEAGEMQLFIQPNEVDTLLEDSIDNAQALLDTYEGKEHIVLHVEIEENLPEIPMDSRRIRQVLNNLLSNGIKFTEKGSVTLKVFAAEDGIHFSVHDTGYGIPQSEMDILFAAFERTTAAKQNAIEGTGLGLPISQFLVRQHGSELTVISEVGVGSTFAFTLPYETPESIKDFRPTDTQQITAILSSRNE